MEKLLPPIGSLDAAIRDHIHSTLKKTNWIFVDAARLLDIHPTRLSRKAKRYGLHPPLNHGEIRRALGRAGGRKRKRFASDHLNT